MIHGVIKTAVPMTEEQLRRIERGFADRMGSYVSFEIQTDESLIGGFLATVNGIVYDASYKTQLESLGRHIRG